MDEKIKKSPITNCWGKIKAKKINVRHVTVFRGYEGAAYSHQAQLISFKGRLLATWSLGVRDEEGPGENMVLSASDDKGDTWSAPIIIARAKKGRAAQTIVVSSGLHASGDKLVAFSGHWDFSPESIMPDGSRMKKNIQEHFLDVRTEAQISHDDGKSWSKPIMVAPNLTNYMPPFKTKAGRLILPGNLSFPWTNDPLGISGWTWAGVPGLNPSVADNYFNMDGINRMARTGQRYNEACCYELEDGTLRMMLRNEQLGIFRLGVSESSDCGLTWSTPELTNYTDATCRAHFGRLPDGRYFGMSCPKPSDDLKLNHGPRTPAILALSSDGTVFDRHFIIGDDTEGSPRMEGNAKHGRYGYPYLHVDGDRGYVIYSVNKEDIAVGIFNMTEIK